MDLSVHNPYSELLSAYIYSFSGLKQMLYILFQRIILARKDFAFS